MRPSATLACALAALVIGSSPVQCHGVYSHLLHGWARLAATIWTADPRTSGLRRAAWRRS